MRKEAEKLLKKKIITGKDMSRVVLLNLVSTMTPAGRPLFTGEELETLVGRLRQTNQDRIDCDPYFSLNSALPDARSYLGEMSDRLTAFTIILGNTLEDFEFSEKLFAFYDKAPLFLSAEDYEALQKKFREKQKDKLLSISDIVYIALLYYLPKTEEKLSALKAGGRGRAMPAAIARGLIKDMREEVSKEDAALLLPLILKRVSDTRPSGKDLEAIESAIKEEIEKLDASLLSASSPDDFERQATEGYQKLLTFEEDAADSYRIELADKKLSSLEGMKKGEFLKLPSSSEDLTEYFFKGESEEERAEGYEAFKKLFPNLQKALLNDIIKNLPELKDASKKPAVPCSRAKRLLKEGLYNSENTLTAKPNELIDLLPLKDRERAEKYGICVMLKDTGRSSFNKDALSPIGARQKEVINAIYERAEYKSAKNTLEVTDNRESALKRVADIITSKLLLLNSYNYFIEEFKAAENIEEIEYLKIDTSHIEGSLISCNSFLNGAIHSLSINGKQDISKLLADKLEYFDLDKYKPDEQLKKRLSALANDVRALTSTSVITSLVLAVQSRKGG